jgi:coenzyme F420-reducing hydrogenase delta subunit
MADDLQPGLIDPNFEPEIVGLACNHCGYASADSAGGLRREYPTAVHMIRLPCTGRIEVIHLLKALEAGADGVFVVGCLEGDCSFMTGNLWARQIVTYVKKLAGEVGLEPERLEMYNIPGPNGAGFAAAATEFTARIKALGPNPGKRSGLSAHAATKAALAGIALPDEQATAATGAAPAAAVAPREEGQPT